MTAVHDIDLPAVLADRLTSASPDVLREMLALFIHTLMGAEADALCGAGYGERSSERTNSRNGYRQRRFDTRTGTLDLAIPKLRQGSYFPDWLLERGKRAERALTTVVATCYLLGSQSSGGIAPCAALRSTFSCINSTRNNWIRRWISWLY